ncbi:thioredoxin domain-containing protein [Sphingobacterium sp. GVS05A]|uniref:thioredoxin domain-containing protein n=1 Tax=Sphingobacterium TaxID=28453 RepID=UPI001CBB9552|nr:thioredoxin domain-containing protein [Sphingobacterium sp. GVS05A]
MNTEKNIFTSILTILDIPYNKDVSNRFYHTHPHKYSLFGISDMLSHYKIRNGAINVDNKSEDIFNIETPFVTKVANDFCIINQVSSEYVSYSIGSRIKQSRIEIFCEEWCGTALLFRKESESIEPNYLSNKKKAQIESLLKMTSISVLFIIIGLSIYKENSNRNIDFLFSFIINSAGIQVGFLLIQKQLDWNNDYTNKICSLFKHADCNTLLQSDAAKLLNTLTWSEIGFGYFIANMFVIIFLPTFFHYYAHLCLLTIPYILWSLWYQRILAKTWCILCLFTLCILFSIIITNLLSGIYLSYDMNLFDACFVLCIYLFSILSIHMLVKQISNNNKTNHIIQQVNSLIANREVVSIILKDQPHYRINKNFSSIHFGDPNSETVITIITNPHCISCATTHKEVFELLKHSKNIAIQYVFTSFSGFEDSSKLLIALFFDKNVDTIEAYNKWFLRKNKQKELYSQFSSIDLSSTTVRNEFDKHKQWTEEMAVEVTPTILINGYKIPINWSVNDLLYISNVQNQ